VNILNLQLSAEPKVTKTGLRIIGYCDAETDTIRIRGLAIAQHPDGTITVMSPRASGVKGPAVLMRPALRAELCDAARAYITDLTRAFGETGRAA
jgi:hypothetical protein